MSANTVELSVFDDGKSHNAKYIEGHAVDDAQRLVALIGGVERHFMVVGAVVFDGKLVVDDRQYDVVVLGAQGLVDHQSGGVADECVFHGVARHFDDKSRCRVADEQPVQVDLALEVVAGGRGEAGLQPCIVDVGDARPLRRVFEADDGYFVVVEKHEPRVC